MFQRTLSFLALLLLTSPLLVLGSEMASSVRVETAPPDSDYCVRCETDEACQSYATGSTCKKGQCTNEDGLFGRNCGCSRDSDCESNRCDGIFQKTCMKRLENGNMCYNDRGCKSGFCNSFLLCAEPTRNGVTVSEETGTQVGAIATAEGANANRTEAITEANENDGGDDVPRCVSCYDSNECDNNWQCIEGFCADEMGFHPITCSTCRGDDDCSEDTFCHGFGLLGRTGKKCAEKRVNGASCSRSEACQSGHCNMLFRCDDHTITEAPAAEPPHSNSYVGLAVWVSFATFLALFLFIAKVLFQREGLKFCSKNDAIIPDREHDLKLDHHGDDGRHGDAVENDQHTHSTADVEEQLQ